MPVSKNHDDIKARLAACHTKLNGLFAGSTTEQELQNDLARIHDYYCLSYKRAVDIESANLIVETYELYVNNLEAVKSGTMLPQEALEDIEDISYLRECGICLHNVIKVCEIAFWSGLLVASYAAAFSAPFLFPQFPVGLALGLVTIGLACYAGNQCLTCFEEFKSMSRLRDETQRELQVVSFFKPQTISQVVTGLELLTPTAQ